LGRTKAPGAVGRWFRDLALPIALRLFASPDSQAWLYRYRIAWNEPLSAGPVHEVH
jgi:hypothetical protein